MHEVDFSCMEHCCLPAAVTLLYLFKLFSEIYFLCHLFQNAESSSLVFPLCWFTIIIQKCPSLGNQPGWITSQIIICFLYQITTAAAGLLWHGCQCYTHPLSVLSSVPLVSVSVCSGAHTHKLWFSYKRMMKAFLSGLCSFSLQGNEHSYWHQTGIILSLSHTQLRYSWIWSHKTS